MLGEANVDRVSRRREATKAEILDAAWDLVAEEGLAGLSLRDLAARVGMRAPSLYQYFDSKHAIYDAMFGQGAREALEEVDINDGNGDPRELLRASAHKMFDFITKNPARTALLFQRTIPGFEPSEESYAPAVALIERFQTFLADHGMTDPDAQDTWTALISGLSNQQLANDPGGARWARLIDRAVDMYLAEFAPDALTSPKKRRKS
jgi:AcrR family transcriptional regulator